MMVRTRSGCERTLAAGLVAVVAALVLLAGSAPAQAAPSLSVSQRSDLNPDGQTVTVSGSGFDTSKGIYVAYCVTPASGQLPTPCGGGADMTGQGGGSTWISDNPPQYGVGLAEPFGSGGSFTVTVQVTAMIGEVDCRVTSCAVVTRADHLRTSDRSQDVVVPVTFKAPAAPEPPAPKPEAPSEAAEETPPAAETGPDAQPSSSGSTAAPDQAGDGATQEQSTPDEADRDTAVEEPTESDDDVPAPRPRSPEWHLDDSDGAQTGPAPDSGEQDPMPPPSTDEDARDDQAQATPAETAETDEPMTDDTGLAPAVPLGLASLALVGTGGGAWFVRQRKKQP